MQRRLPRISSPLRLVSTLPRLFKAGRAGWVKQNSCKQLPRRCLRVSPTSAVLFAVPLLDVHRSKRHERILQRWDSTEWSRLHATGNGGTGSFYFWCYARYFAFLLRATAAFPPFKGGRHFPWLSKDSSLRPLFDITVLLPVNFGSAPKPATQRARRHRNAQLRGVSVLLFIADVD